MIKMHFHGPFVLLEYDPYTPLLSELLTLTQKQYGNAMQIFIKILFTSVIIIFPFLAGSSENLITF